MIIRPTVLLFLLFDSIISQSVCQPKKYSGANCQADYWCKSGHCVTNRCVPQLPQLGQECGDFKCDDGLGCNQTTNKCESLPKDGQKCLMAPEGPIKCAEGFACYGGICAKISNNTDSPCSDVEFKCPEGLGCSFLNSGKTVCVKRRQLGESCTAHECGNGLYCDFATLKCANYLQISDDCSNDFGSCGAGLDCRSYRSFLFVKKAKCLRPTRISGTLCTSICGGDLFCGPYNKYFA